MADQKLYVDRFAEGVIDDLAKGAAPWQKTWKSGEITPPFNPVSEKRYAGINLVALMREQLQAKRDDPRYMTPKQAENNVWRVKNGENGAVVQFWQFQGDRPQLRFANVFHASQVEGVPPWKAEEHKQDFDPERAAKILQNAGVNIVHDSKRAFYRVDDDSIHLPPRESFGNDQQYYSTALHELTRACGHPDRMNRPSGPKGSEIDTREELRAEIASWMLSMDMGLPFEPRGQFMSAARVEELKKDPHEIIRACRDAEKIVGFIKNLEQKREIPEVEKAEYKSGHEGLAVTPAPSSERTGEIVYLNVPYEQRYLAKNAGAQWDREAKLWYARADGNIDAFSRWMPEKTLHEASVTSLSPQEEFARSLKEVGLDLRGELPLMDGQIHRVPLLDGSPHKKDGAYKGFLDGVPAGYVENFQTGEKSKWKYSGHMLSGDQILKLRAEAAKRREAEAKERSEHYDRSAKRCYAIWKNCDWPKKGEQEYLNKKQVEAFGVKVDAMGNLVIAGRNADGVLRTIQTITSEVKKFESGAEMRGTFHAVDPDNKLAHKDTPILIAEGYATAASVHMGTGFPVVSAFNAGNLTAVAKSLREKYPDKPIIIMADDDRGLENNPGLTKAWDAAKAVGGTVIVPDFTPEEKSQGLTDFNDLHCARGLEAVYDQCLSSIARTMETLQANAAKPEQ
ncbi:MAG: DUF5710 domain-containing protein, partial [Desulfovibrio sp.]|nr:DUF5710 domain-containing protein [Desulfovibrio sp.]